MRQKAKAKRGVFWALLIILAAAAVCLFLVWGLNEKNWDYNLPRRLKKVAAIVLTGSGIAVSSLIFQTVTNNRILTPSVMGLDSLYMFLQTMLVFFFGGDLLAGMSRYSEFAISCVLMIGFSLGLYGLVFGRGNRNIFVLVLVGMVFGSFFGSLSSFMQALIDPNEFLIVQGKMFASFNNVNSNLLGISAVVVLGCFLYLFATHRRLDVLTLGQESAIGLGVDYDKVVRRYLVIVALLVSVATALVGPVTFLGVLVVNLARQMFPTHRHLTLGAASSLLSIVALVGGQFLVERVFTFSTTISVIVNFLGGIYFLFLLLKERSA